MTGANLIFLVGSPRSGTTFLQRLLAAHPRIRTGQESNLFQYVGPMLQRWRAEAEFPDARGGVGLGCYFLEERFTALVREFLDNLLEPMLAGLEPGMLFIEKTPHHALFIPEILTMLPAARFIHILRDPRDVAASMLAASRSWGKAWAPGTAGRAAWTWCEYVQAVMDTRDRVPPEQFTEVRYEELVEAAAPILRSLSRFLKLDWDDEAIAQAVRDNSVEAARRGEGTVIPKGGEFARKSGGVVREPEGFVRSGSAGGWRRDLRWIDQWRVRRVAGELMQRVGYR